MKDIWIFTLFVITLGVIAFTSYKLSSPEQKRLEKYMLFSTEIVECAQRSTNSCGIFLKDCTNGEAYFCQQNITRLKEKQ